MADITMCKGTNCPLKEKCYRYRAKVNPYSQSYFMEIPYKENRCEYFEEINSKIYKENKD